MTPRELRLRARIDVLSDRIELLQHELDLRMTRERRALYAARRSRDFWKMRALRK